MFYGDHLMKGESVISVVDIVKEFPGVKALGGISFDVKAGEIHCLVGENGAGKSTLMKVLSGAYEPTSGKIIVEGKEYDSLSPALSRELGISIVYQENDLVPAMDVVENIYVGSEITRNGVFVDKKAMREKILLTMKEYGISIDIDRLVEHLSVSDQQFVKILKALSFFPKVLILDEPTSMFNTEDSKKVLDLVRRISSMGIGVIYISHFLEEVVSIADRITVIRDGSVISTYDNSGHDTPLSKITNDMVGRPVDMFFQKDKCPIGDVCLEIRDLQLTKDSPKISFSVRKGEILGVFGMVGAGKDSGDTGLDFLQRSCGIDNPEHDPGIAEFPVRLFDSYPFHNFRRLAQSGRINEPEENAIDVHRLFDSVPGCPVDIRHYRPVFPEQGIEQCALANICRADQSDRDTVLDCISEPERIHKPVDMRQDTVNKRVQPASVREFNILIAEIQFQLHQRDNFQQTAAHILQF